MSKNYAMWIPSIEIVKFTEEITPTNKFSMNGTVVMNLWGGGKGSYPVSPATWEMESGILEKSDIWKNMRDDGFGCESYESCNVTVFQHVTVKRTYHEISNDRVTEFKDTIEVFDNYINRKDV
jgi:hypothetical protein